LIKRDALGNGDKSFYAENVARFVVGRIHPLPHRHHGLRQQRHMNKINIGYKIGYKVRFGPCRVANRNPMKGLRSPEREGSNQNDPCELNRVAVDPFV